MFPSTANRLAISRWTRRLLLGVLLVPVGNVQAAEYALIVGGGNTPQRNPVSLERQVLRAVKVLKEQKFARVDVLFADGDDDEPDLVDEMEPENESWAERYLRLLYGPAFTFELPLRNHRVPHVLGAATLANVQAWFQEQGSQLQKGDELLLYFATHGTLAGGEPTSGKSELLLWDGGRLTVQDLQQLVDQLPAGVQVRLLVTACYSGGFAKLGWPEAKTSRLPVAGFFATAYDRPAAGCTSEAELANLRDYATCFWSALSGTWPNGAAISDPLDLDGDDSVSFGEAHAFALVHDTTLDTPLKTSDYALRRISRFGRVDELAQEANLLTRTPSYEELRAAASPSEQQLLDQLCTRLSLTGQRRLSQARQEMRQLEIALRNLAEQRAEHHANDAALRGEQIAQLQQKFPALAMLLNQPEAKPAAIRQFLQQHAESLKASVPNETLEKLNGSAAKLRELDDTRLAKEQRWAHYQRFLLTADSVILAHNLPLVVTDKTVRERFAALQTAENGP